MKFKRKLSALTFALMAAVNGWAATDDAYFVETEQSLCYDGTAIVTTIPVQITLADQTQLFSLIYKSENEQRETQSTSWNDTSDGLYNFTTTVSLNSGETHRDIVFELVSIYTQTSGTTALSSTYTIHLYAQPYADITTDESTCGLVATLTADEKLSDISVYEWEVDYGELSSSTGASVTDTLTEPTTIMAKLTETAGGTCVSTVYKNITVLGSPTATLAFDDENPSGDPIVICTSLDDEKEISFGADLTLTGNELFSVTLSNGQSFSELSLGTTNVEVIANAEGSITLVDAIDAHGCYALESDLSGSLPVVDRKPKITMPTDTATFASGSSIELSVELTDSANEYGWEMCEEQSDFPTTFSNLSDGVTSMTTTITGLHKMIYTETNYGDSGTEQGCSASAERTIYVENVAKAPNGFSPNGDGTNDALVIVGLVEENQLTVYDALGKIVYEKANYRNDWTADNLPDGYYIYTATGQGMKTVKETLVIKRSIK